MITIVIEGAIFGLFAYGPLISYAIWSWRWLRRRANEGYNGKIWVVPLAVSLIVAVTWSIMVAAVGVMSVLTSVNLKGEEVSFAGGVFTIALLPARVVYGIIDLLPSTGIPRFYEAQWLYWFLAATIIVALLVLVSSIEWLLIRLIHVGKSDMI